MDVKYIRTSNNQIIVFSCLIQHSTFKSFNPISAGFIRFGTREAVGTYDYYEVSCRCYGESISLNLKANEVEDTELARRQILGYDYWWLT